VQRRGDELLPDTPGATNPTFDDASTRLPTRDQ
jgi:hypothetical protein